MPRNPLVKRRIIRTDGVETTVHVRADDETALRATLIQSGVKLAPQPVTGKSGLTVEDLSISDFLDECDGNESASFVTMLHDGSSATLTYDPDISTRIGESAFRVDHTDTPHRRGATPLHITKWRLDEQDEPDSYARANVEIAVSNRFSDIRDDMYALMEREPEIQELLDRNGFCSNEVKSGQFTQHVARKIQRTLQVNQDTLTRNTRRELESIGILN